MGDSVRTHGGEDRHHPLAMACGFGLAWALVGTMQRVLLHLLADVRGVEPSHAVSLLGGCGAELLWGALAGLLASLVRTAGASLFLLIPAASANLAAARYRSVFGVLPGRSALLDLENIPHLGASVSRELDTLGLLLSVALPALVGMLLGRWAARRVAQAESLLDKRWLAASGLLVLVSGSVLALTRGDTQRAAAGSLGALLIPSGAQQFELAGATPALDGAHPALLQMGSLRPGPPSDPRYPLCAPLTTKLPPPAPRAQNVILLVLESVDDRALALEREGTPVMPRLRAFAERHTRVTPFYAVGVRSHQALPALLAGVPAIPFRAPLKHAPLAHFHGLPDELGRAGIVSAYLHGGDLGFEQQRAFLEEVGFDHVIEPRPGEDEERVGWGVTDAAMLARLEQWLEDRRTKQEGARYFAALSTLTTHHPFTSPADFEPPFAVRDEVDRFAATLAYLDRALGDFLAWYERVEAPRGTALIITADHGAPVRWPDTADPTTTGEQEYDFGVPLIIAGLEDTPRLLHRAGHQADIPQTVLGIFGLPDQGCFQGRDLLDARLPFPEERWLPAMGGLGLELVYVHHGTRRALFRLEDQRLTDYDLEADPKLRQPLPPTPGVRLFIDDFLRLGQQLASTNGYAPEKAAAARSPRPRVERPRFVAHRARLDATSGEGNRLADLERALENGVDWAEIDLQPTADHQLVLHHDPTLVLPDGTEHVLLEKPLDELRALPEGPPLETLEEALVRFGGRIGLLLELKPTRLVYANQQMVRAVLRTVARHPPRKGLVIDSFSREMLSTVESLSEHETAYDLPQKPVQREWLEYAAEQGFDWIYVRHDLATPAVIQAAHRLGLYVAVYTINDAADLARFASEWPDAVMSDRPLALRESAGGLAASP